MRQGVTRLSDFISYEAGRAFIRLAKHDEITLTNEDDDRLSEVKAGIAKLEKIPFGVISPIVFSFIPTTRLNVLLDPQKVVTFNLRGFGSKERWPWVKPTTGFLVWDPLRQGNITSGQQMFGSYTFQIFWRNGYEALRALDDNEDGVLSGAELDGISAWFDANSDGRCTANEVTPVTELSVTSIAVQVTGSDGISPMNSAGITLRDGSTLPTWDWMAQPVTGSSVQQTSRKSLISH
jgi:hypothetical protein